MNSSHTPLEPSERIRCALPSQKLKSPTMRTPRAFGAQTAKLVPVDAAGVPADVRPEHRPELLVPTLGDQVLIDLADRRQEAVRVVDGERLAVRVADLQPVVPHRAARQARLPYPGLVQGPRRVALAVGEDGDRLGVRLERADEQALPGGGAEDGVRVGRGTADEPFEFVAGRTGRVGVGEPASRRAPGSGGEVARVVLQRGLAARARRPRSRRLVLPSASAEGTSPGGPLAGDGGPAAWRPRPGTATPGGVAGGAGLVVGGASRRWHQPTSRSIAESGMVNQLGRCRASYITSYTALSSSKARSTTSSSRGSEPQAAA